MPSPMRQLPPTSLGAFQASVKQPRLDPMAEMRTRVASNVMESQAEGGSYEDYLIDGWGYRLYPDLSIKVISAPEGYKSGAKLDGGPAYEAVMSAIKQDYDNRTSRGQMDHARGQAVTDRFATSEAGARTDETSGIDALLNAVPEVSAASEQVPSTQQKAIYPGRTPGSYFDKMKPGEELDFDPNELLTGVK